MAEPKAAKRAPSKSEGKPRRKKKAAAEPRSRGIAPDAIGSGAQPAALTRLAEAIEADGGSVLAPYKDPLGGNWQIFAALPIDLVEPTPFQRDLSKPHVDRLSSAMDRLGRYLDPMIVVRGDASGKDGRRHRYPYWTPNGNHRLAALKALGARSVVAIVVPDIEVAHRILLLNTEKAHNLRERSLEVIRLAELLADDRGPARKGLRDRVRGAGPADARALLPGERPLCRRRLPPGAPPGREVVRIGAAEGAGDPAGAGCPGAGAGCGGDGGDEEAEGARFREPVSPSVRHRPDQSAPVQARGKSGRG